MLRVLFLCLGNICRSPMAEAIFRQKVMSAGLAHEIEIDSAGLGGWHAGERPHRGTLQVLSGHGIPHDGLISRQIQQSDFDDFDYIIAMDEENMAGLASLVPSHHARIFRLLDLVDDVAEKNVPDPYFTGKFDEVYDLVERGCQQLLRLLQADDRLAESARLAPEPS